MPDNNLRAACAAKGWSQGRVVYEISLYARHHAIAVANTASLKVYVSEWENRRRTVSAPYTRILRALFGMTDAELFGQTQAEPQFVDGYDELAGRIDAACSVSRSAVEVFLTQTEAFRTLDRQLGAARLVDSMDQHISTMADALTFAVLPHARRPLAEALSGAATLAAWQALDVGAANRAWRHYELAKQAAHEAVQPRYLAHAMGEQAYVLSDTGQHELAVQLVEAALEVGDSVPPRLMAWLLSALAELHAINGNVVACRRCLDQAAQVMPSDDVLRDPEMPSIFLTQEHLIRWRGHSLALAGDERSVLDLYAAMGAMEGTFTRALAGLHCDLAQAHLVRHEFGDAADNLRTAQRLANRTGSIRYRRRVERLTYRLPS